jgi:methionyl aminopeptidase
MSGKIRKKTPKEMDLMRQACSLAAETLRLAGEMVKPGVKLSEIDDFVREYTFAQGAYPAPLNYHGFPKSVCLSVNEVVTHGIPSDKILAEGDIVNVDVTSRLNGYHGDCSRTFLVGQVSDEAKRITDVAEQALYEGIKAAKIGAFFSEIGEAIQAYCDEQGYTVVRDYCGHGIGRGFHEDPLVLHYRTARKGPRIEPGMCFTIEPMVNQGDWKVKLLKDGWTVVTTDGLLSAQFEHTLAVTTEGIEVLTLQKGEVIR